MKLGVVKRTGLLFLVAVGLIVLIMASASLGKAKAAVTERDMTRSSAVDGVIVDAVLRNPLEPTSPRGVVWDLYLTTHSGDLSSLKIADMVQLRNDRGYTAESEFRFAWTVKSSHHPVGRLILELPPEQWAQLLSPKAKAIELVITGIGTLQERVFKWEKKWVE